MKIDIKFYQLVGRIMCLNDNETCERILEAAVELFSQRGYTAVRLRDIATAVGLQHASLYYYVPGGKEQLFIEVLERNFHRHREGLTQAIQNAGNDIREQLLAVMGWFLSQPPMDLARLYYADMPQIDASQAERLMRLALDSMRIPIITAIESANAAGQIEIANPGLAAMALVNLAQGVKVIPESYVLTAERRERISEEVIDMLLNGWRKR
jgi:AcrR family transcriptional regulator